MGHPGKWKGTDLRLSGRLETDRLQMLSQLEQAGDLVVRELQLASPEGPVPALLCYLHSMVDLAQLEEHVIWPLLDMGMEALEGTGAGRVRLPMAQAESSAAVDKLISTVLRGMIVILIDGQRQGLMLNARKPPGRPVEQSDVEVSVHGGREAFTTLLQVNLGLIRKRLPTPDLRMQRLMAGGITRTELVLLHIAGKAGPDLVDETWRRLQRLNPEGVLDTEELVAALADRPKSIFPTVLISERPDLVVRYLMSGHVAILAENSSEVLLLPGRLIDFLCAVDDIYEKRPFVALVRTARVLALTASIFLPSGYVAVTTFHLQALPTQLTLSLLAQREGAPLPTPVEAFLMVITFEILREAGLRLPRPVGPSVSIVGGLVIGEAAMRAGVTSPAMVLVVSATAVSTFAIPSTSLANVATVLRLGLLILSSLFGFFGVMIGYVAMLAHVAGLTSGRVPYAMPVMPLLPGFLKDALGIMERAPRGPGPNMDPAMARPPGGQDRKPGERR